MPLIRYSLMSLLALLCLVLTPSIAEAQTAKRDIRRGNMLMRDSLPAEADVWYRRALQVEPKNPYASFNLGIALLDQQKNAEGHDLFHVAIRHTQSKSLKNKAYYNAGVALQRQEKLDEAIEAYKHALRLNPHDEEARYNLAVCKRKKQQNEQNKPKQQPKKNNKPQNQGQNPNEGQGQGQSNNGDQQQPQGQATGKMTKEEADRLLNVSRQQDRDVQERLKKQGKPQSNVKEKYW